MKGPLDWAREISAGFMHEGDEMRAIAEALLKSDDDLRRMTEIAVSRASIATLATIRSRITRLTLAAGLPHEVWAELCRLDSDMSAMGIPGTVNKESV